MSILNPELENIVDAIMVLLGEDALGNFEDTDQVIGDLQSMCGQWLADRGVIITQQTPLHEFYSIMTVVDWAYRPHEGTAISSDVPNVWALAEVVWARYPSSDMGELTRLIINVEDRLLELMSLSTNGDEAPEDDDVDEKIRQLILGSDLKSTTAGAMVMRNAMLRGNPRMYIGNDIDNTGGMVKAMEAIGAVVASGITDLEAIHAQAEIELRSIGISPLLDADELVSKQLKILGKQWTTI